jgi:hypothetical protein
LGHDSARLGHALGHGEGGQPVLQVGEPVDVVVMEGARIPKRWATAASVTAVRLGSTPIFFAKSIPACYGRRRTKGEDMTRRLIPVSVSLPGPD